MQLVVEAVVNLCWGLGCQVGQSSDSSGGSNGLSMPIFVSPQAVYAGIYVGVYQSFNSSASRRLAQILVAAIVDQVDGKVFGPLAATVAGEMAVAVVGQFSGS